MGWEATVSCDDAERPGDGECQNEDRKAGCPPSRAVGVGLVGQIVRSSSEKVKDSTGCWDGLEELGVEGRGFRKH